MVIEGGSTQGNFHTHLVEQLCQLLRLDSESFEWLDHLSSSEWSGLLENATQFGFAPLCYYLLKRHGQLQNLPGNERDKLKRSYLVARVRSAQRIQDLSGVIKILKEIEIPIIFLKGTYLSEEIYPDRATREMSDIDLLVPKDLLEKAVEALTTLEYFPNRNFWTEFETRVSHQLPILIRSNHTPIELHWTLFEPKLTYKVDLEELWRRALPISSSQITGYKLSPEDLLLHLTIHAASQHQLTGGLRFVYDTALALHHFRGQIDWLQLEARAGTWHARSPLYLMLRLSQDLFGIGAPENFMNNIQPDQFNITWIETAKDLLFLRLDDHPKFSGTLASMLGEQDPFKRIKLIFDRIFISNAELAEKYSIDPSSPFIFTYYPHHIRVLICRHFASLVGYLRHENGIRRSAEVVRVQKKKEKYLREQLTNGGD